MGAAFLLDDPSECSTAVSPVSRRLRIALRSLAVLPVALRWWGGLLLLLRADANREAWQAVPVAAVVVRSPPHNGGGVSAAPVIIAIVVLGQLAPERFRLFPLPGDPRGAQVHQLWLGLLGAAIVLLLWATRDLAGWRFPGIFRNRTIPAGPRESPEWSLSGTRHTSADRQ